MTEESKPLTALDTAVKDRGRHLFKSAKYASGVASFALKLNELGQLVDQAEAAKVHPDVIALMKDGLGKLTDANKLIAMVQQDGGDA